MKKSLIFCMTLIVFTFPQSLNAEQSNDQTKVTIESGPLSISPAENEIVFDVNEDEEEVTDSVGEITVVDATGSWEGWNVTVQASQLKEEGNPEETLPPGSLHLTHAEATIKEEAGAGQRPSWTIDHPTAIDQEPVKILAAEPNRGMGTYHIQFSDESLILDLPEDEEFNDQTTYQSTMTWTINKGP
ncbi:WxL domain-containing protein [Texcoconibacillus texcoconensis]|uniref:WxL domain-containing protein n=1 Tax=Texcoconibacillus texcoconensis TaxID=1095777 RepID=A0A840QTB2_9BACI|nr:WxL domain-containing protein [Texcoconibacillus texcoconensis]MBB5174605.1 hypothetical protein [Texcoconibacillus texcoconensis]